MADFLTSLWESVFTPGTTPTLLIATNAAFGSLQVLLLILFFFTHSIHFLILSILCGGLWYSINWFATEVEAAKAQDAAGTQQAAKSSNSRSGGGRTRDTAKRRSPDPGSDTETETQSMPPPPPAVRKPAPAPMPDVVKDILGQSTGSSTSPSTNLEPKGPSESEMLRRRRSLADSSGDISTDSEWEKVSEGEGKSK